MGNELVCTCGNMVLLKTCQVNRDTGQLIKEDRVGFICPACGRLFEFNSETQAWTISRYQPRSGKWQESD